MTVEKGTYGTVVLALHDALGDDPQSSGDFAERVTVERADPVVLIAESLYDAAVAGELHGVEAGEGLLTITAQNGVWRYRLTGERDGGAFVATLCSAPSRADQEADRG